VDAVVESDLVAQVDEYLEAHPAANQPVAVAMVGTSGSTSSN
jgi:hypothetical protein